MTEIENDNALFDEKIIIDQSQCCFCKIELTQANKSLYRMHFKDNGKPSIGCICLMCKEVFERLQGSIQCKPTKTEAMIKLEVYAEGWTDEMLKAKEEMSLNILN